MIVATGLAIFVLIACVTYLVMTYMARKRHASPQTTPCGESEATFAMNSQMLATETEYDWHNIDAAISEYAQITHTYRAFDLDGDEGLTCVAFDANDSLHIFFEARPKAKQAKNYADDHDPQSKKRIVHYRYAKNEIYACKKERIYSQQRVPCGKGAIPEYICYIIIHIQIRQQSTEKKHSINFGQEYHGSYADMLYAKLQNRPA